MKNIISIGCCFFGYVENWDHERVGKSWGTGISSFLISPTLLQVPKHFACYTTVILDYSPTGSYQIDSMQYLNSNLITYWNLLKSNISWWMYIIGWVRCGALFALQCQKCIAEVLWLDICMHKTFFIRGGHMDRMS